MSPWECCFGQEVPRLAPIRIPDTATEEAPNLNPNGDNHNPNT